MLPQQRQIGLHLHQRDTLQILPRQGTEQQQGIENASNNYDSDNPGILSHPRALLLLLIDMEKMYSLSLSSLSTVILMSLTIIGVAKELSNTCDEDIQLWLLGTASRAFLVTSVKLYVEGSLSTWTH